MAEKIVLSFEIDNKGAVKDLKKFRGEVDDVPKSTKKASAGIDRMKSALVALGGTVAAVQIGRFMRDSIGAASEQQQVFTSLAASLKNVGVNYNDVGNDLQSMFSKLQEVTVYGDTDTAATLQNLVSTTGDYTASLKLLTPTLEFASAKHIDLSTAARLVGQAATGMTGTLSRYGIVLSETTKEQLKNADAMERAEIMAAELQQRFGGAAAAEVETYAGKIQKMSNYWGDFREALGDVIVKTQAAPGVFEDLIKAINLARAAAINFGVSVVAIANFDFGGAVTAMTGKATAAFLRMFARVNRELAKLPRWLGGEAYGEQAEFAETLAKNLDAIADINLKQNFSDTADAVREFLDSVNNVTVAIGGSASGGGAVAGGSGGGLIGATSDAVDMWKLLGKEAQITAAEAMESIEGIAYSLDDKFKKAAEKSSKFFEGTWSPTVVGTVEDTANIMQSTFSDLLGKGFMGELDSFSDLWDEIWQDLAKSMTGIIGDAFESLFIGGGSGGGKSFTEILQRGGAGGLGGMIGGAGALFGGIQQGGMGGALMGGLGGSLLGFAAGSSLMPAGMLFGAGLGPIGAIAGGVLGALLGGLGIGGQSAPRARGNIGLDGGYLSTMNQSMDARSESLWVTQRAQEYRDSVSAMNDILRMFGDSSLFSMVGAAPTFSFGGGGQENPIDQLATIFREQFLPDAMREMFTGAINQGLGGLGVNDATIQQLWQELGGEVGDSFFSGLETFIGALKGVTDLYDDMDWNVIQDEVRMNSFQSFMKGMSEIADAAGMQMLGINDMTLLERAEQAQTVEQLITQARQAEIQFLQQIDALQQGINRSIDQQIEGIMVGGMSRTEQIGYFEDQINDIMSTLRGGVTSPEELQMLMGDLSGYVSSMQGVLGDGLYMSPMGGDTWADWLTGVLSEAQGLSDTSFDNMRDQVREQNQALVDQLGLLITALTDFQADLLTGPGAGGDVNVTIIPDSNGLVNFVYQVVDERMNAGGGTPIN